MFRLAAPCSEVFELNVIAGACYWVRFGVRSIPPPVTTDVQTTSYPHHPQVAPNSSQQPYRSECPTTTNSKSLSIASLVLRVSDHKPQGEHTFEMSEPDHALLFIVEHCNLLHCKQNLHKFKKKINFKIMDVKMKNH